MATEEAETNNAIIMHNCDGLRLLQDHVPDNSINLILTDPPYIISHETGMNAHFNAVKNKKDTAFMKTEQEWELYKTKHFIENDEKKDNYMNYGTIYGKKYCVKTDYGAWDADFTIHTLDMFIKQYYKKLKQGGTLIMFFDIWKISFLKEIMEKHRFKQIRFIEWIKTNPQPLNSNTNYLTNCREIALLGVKGGKPVFNSKYDNGIYQFPLQGGKVRFHPTQKSIALFEELIKKHSNEGDTVMDTFMGGGTTALASIATNRRFIGCELDKSYYIKSKEIIDAAMSAKKY